MVQQRSVGVKSDTALRAVDAPCHRRPLGRERPLLTVLSVSGNQQDHDALRRMIEPSWTLRQSLSLKEARGELRNHRFAILFCDQDSMPDAWKSLHHHATPDGSPPFVVVASRLADASLWAEALNLGAWDVVAKPLDEQEVLRVLDIALTRWKAQSNAAPSLSAAASI